MKTIQKNSTSKKWIFSTVICVLLFVSCDKFHGHAHESDFTSTEILEKSSPWITTAVFKVVDGEVDKSVNFIEEPEANGTVSSAQYRDGKFIFVPVNPITGDFETPITLETNTANYGKFRIVENEGKEFRELFDTGFGYTNQREITETNTSKFTYSFQPQSSTNTFVVEHEPYVEKFPDKAYPEELTDVVNKRFESLE